MSISLYQGDNIEVLKTMADESVDSIVTDPPYGLKFMGKKWDHEVPSVEFWTEVFRVLKPGGHVLSFSGTRTYHRMVVNIEDAGFEIRDQIGWLFGQGFPKSMDVSKAIDKALGAEREVLGTRDPRSLYDGRKRTSAALNTRYRAAEDREDVRDLSKQILTAPATDAAKQWEGWGTALKPAWEPCVVARKPLIGTVVENVLAHGVGALNVDGCRVETTENLNGGRYAEHGDGEADGTTYGSGINKRTPGGYKQPTGRWPANVIHDGSDEVEEAFAAYGERAPGRFPKNSGGIGTDSGIYGKGNGRNQVERNLDGGSASRFFYCAKASKKDRAGSKHPTVKPVALMAYLCNVNIRLAQVNATYCPS